MINSRAKGNRAEREVIKILKKYWLGKWERRSMGVCGSDIIPPPSFPYAVEVKCIQQIKLKHLFKPTAIFHGCWKQACFQAGREHKLPLLCMKIEGTWLAYCSGAVAMPSYSDWLTLEDWCKYQQGE